MKSKIKNETISAGFAILFITMLIGTGCSLWIIAALIWLGG